MYDTIDHIKSCLYGLLWTQTESAFWIQKELTGALWTLPCRDRKKVPTMKSQGAAKNEANNTKASAPVAQEAPIVEEKIDFSNVKIEPIFEEMVDNHIPADAKLY